MAAPRFKSILYFMNRWDLPRVSFVIPVQDDEVRLRRCLESIARNGYPADRREVVVVDNGSRDGSGRVAVEVGARADQ